MHTNKRGRESGVDMDESVVCKMLELILDELCGF